MTVCARSVVLQRSGSARYAMGRTAVTLDATHRYALGALHVLALPPVLISLFATGKRHGLSLAAHRLGARIGTLDVDRSLCKAVSCWDGATGARSRAAARLTSLSADMAHGADHDARAGARGNRRLAAGLGRHVRACCALDRRTHRSRLDARGDVGARDLRLGPRHCAGREAASRPALPAAQSDGRACRRRSAAAYLSPARRRQGARARIASRRAQGSRDPCVVTLPSTADALQSSCRW